MVSAVSLREMIFMPSAVVSYEGNGILRASAVSYTSHDFSRGFEGNDIHVVSCGLKENYSHGFSSGFE